MYPITIAERLKPFSHLPGSACLIPGTHYIVEAFPALVRIKEFSGRLVKEISVTIQAPLKNFTLMQDLEKGCVTLFSENYHFHILPSLEIVYGKNAPAQLYPSRLKNGDFGCAKANSSGGLGIDAHERISFGNHKKQEWEQIKRRLCLREVLPLWFRLGSLLKLPGRKGDDRGPFALLQNAKRAIQDHRPETILPHFHNLFLAAFTQMLIPSSYDPYYQGILPLDSAVSEDSPLYLLTEGSALIRSMFLISMENEISLLPNLPPQFFAGRLVNMQCPPYGSLDLEWSQKTLRKLHFHAVKEGALLFHFPANLRSFRLRVSERDRGHTLSCGDLLEIKSGSHYLLDRFEK